MFLGGRGVGVGIRGNAGVVVFEEFELVEEAFAGCVADGRLTGLRMRTFVVYTWLYFRSG